MNPTFTVSVDLVKRKTSVTGLVAVGEKVNVVISGFGDYSVPEWEPDNTEGFSGAALRFRLVAPDGKDLVRFPLAEGDKWSGYGGEFSAEVDFNTMQLRKWLRGFPIDGKAEVGVIVDSVVDAMEYGRGTVKILQWAASPVEDPTILPDWRKTLRDLNAAIVEISSKTERAETAAQAAKSARDDAQTAKKSAETAANNARSSESAAKGFKNNAESASKSAGVSANNAASSRTAAESAKSAAETARDEAKGYAEFAESTLANAATKAELQAEVERAKTTEQSLENQVTGVSSKVDTVIGGDPDKSARTIAAEEVAKVVANAPADLDTLKEIADYIASDKTGAAQMVANIDTNTKSISAEVKRAKDAESALAGRVKELEEKPSVEVVSPSANGAGKAADAKDTYDALEEKLDKSDVVPMSSAATGQAADAADAYQQYVAVRQIATTAEEKAIGALVKADEALNQANGARDWAVTAQMEANAASQAANAAQQTASAAIPKYPFKTITATGLNDDNGDYYEDVRLEPYVNSTLPGLGLIGPVKVSVESGAAGCMRDLQFTIDLTSAATAPTITWGATFHPRTDAETDFACVAGVRNVYWISEYAEGEFVVAGWQETTGGNAS